MQLGCVSARGGGGVIASVGAALLLAAAIAGCGNHGAGASAVKADTLPAASGTSGCGQHEASGSVQYTVTVSGHRRTVIVHVPAGYTGKRKLALVLNLHGSESTASAQEKFSGMDATADADHFIVAYPQALIADGLGYDWNIPGEPMVNGKFPSASAPSDVAFLTTLVRDLAGRYCVALSRVYATGVSGGGRMASQLGCDASSVFAAIAPVAGLRYPSPCPASRPVSVIAFHGTADLIDPFNGHGLGYWTYSVPTAAHLWASHDHCAASPQSTARRGYHLTRYAGCSGGTQVELYAISGEGHEWPGGPAMPSTITNVLGPQSNAVSADALMWAFFRAHPLS
jgi:polyhydroxybutyrate depolymerase